MVAIPVVAAMMIAPVMITVVPVVAAMVVAVVVIKAVAAAMITVGRAGAYPKRSGAECENGGEFHGKMHTEPPLPQPGWLSLKDGFLAR